MTMLDRSKLCFDLILVRAAGNNFNPISIEAFVELPVNERIALISQKKIRFLKGEGEVNVYDATKSLSEARGD